MAAPTPEGYKKAYARCVDQYKTSSGASALFYYSNPDGHEEQGVRIEAPEVMKEFIDNVAYGRDPEGTLFFNHVEDLDGKTKYNVIYSDNTVPDEDHCVIVQFFGATQGRFYAEFVARDPNRNVTWIVDGTQHRGGSWDPLALATATAYVSKRSSESTVTISIKPISKTVTFDVPAGSDTWNPVSVWGNLSTNDISKIAVGVRSIVDYNDDRIVLYPENSSTDMTAVFIPINTKASDKDALGGMRWISGSQIAVWGEYVGKI